MSQIPLPERGQPIDLAYIYQIAEAINTLSAQITPSTNRYVTIETPLDGKQSVLSSGVKMNAAYINVTSTSASVLAGQEEDFSYSFPAEYKFAPVATATLVNIGGTASGKDASVFIKNVTTSRIDGTVRFNSGGELTVGVNLIVIGIPN
jgi:hypothetical protein